MQDKVLIIDDDIDTLKLVGLMLRHRRYQIRAAIGPAPELLVAASARRLPAAAADPDNVTSQQGLALVDRILLPLART